jgi:hypothetical protein
MCNPASSQRLSVNALRIGLIEIGLWFMHHQHDIKSAKERATIERHIATATAAQKLLATAIDLDAINLAAATVRKEMGAE